MKRTTAAAGALVLLGALMVSQAPAANAIPSEPTNLALTATATASSVELDRADFQPSMAIDGNPNTRFSSGYQDNAWFQVRLQTPSVVDHVVIAWPNACAKAYRLQVSTDGATWTNAASYTGQDTCARTDTVQLNTAGAVSYIRMQGITRKSVYGYSISEFEVYGVPGRSALALVPQPVSVSRGSGAPFAVTAGTVIVASGSGTAPATQLATVLRRSTGFALPVVASSTASSKITVVVAAGNAPAGQPAEGYTLAATSAGVTIGADTAAGALNGVQTLRQLLPPEIEAPSVRTATWTVPPVTISDYPRFAYRGLEVDVARSFYTVAEVKRLIDHASQFKINRLHLHLSDDQGWRIAMTNPASNPSGIDYTALTRVSGATAVQFDGTAATGSNPGTPGYYTAADYQSIVAYAGQNGMVVVPELDMPGHTGAALHAIPQLNGGGSMPALTAGQTVLPVNTGNTSLGNANPATDEFIGQVLSQLAAMTPGPYLHVGGDEAPTPAAAYVDLVDTETSTATSLGKTPIVWNEASATNLPTGSIIQLWTGNGATASTAVAQRGAKVIMSPASKTYYPQKQDSRQPLGATWACGGPCTLQNAYSWNPATFVSGIGEASVLGVEGAFWGEFIRGADQAEYYSFPRMLATAEVGWTPQTARDQADFLARVSMLGGRMTLEGVNFFPTADVSWQTQIGARVTALSPTAGGSASIDVSVLAPGAAAADLTATVDWGDGTSSPVTLTAARTSDIAAMTLNSAFTATVTHSYATSGSGYVAIVVHRAGSDQVVTRVLH
ncbi:family 20 glycosylhydrolase [Leifsonia sp. NCR5]|uniref:family 20 glycosylhydrolase n=1 Tax=Leifsonia sp. NCR5 TaxID=1978342 RepID=UPI000A18D50E|nr:family 20 glycosylhydrolase [Leifsonia sp. NCR5]